jgi:hypothetical protein
MVPLYKVREEKDSFVYGYSCRLEDTSVNLNKVYGLFDGNKLFLREGRNVFSDLEGLGKHPFYAFISDVNNLDVGSPLRLGVSFFDALVSRPKEVVYFYNKKRKLVEASTVAMILLLNDDKDLESEFRKEKVKNTQAFKKYLLKMNERYPY